MLDLQSQNFFASRDIRFHELNFPFHMISDQSFFFYNSEVFLPTVTTPFTDDVLHSSTFHDSRDSFTTHDSTDFLASIHSDTSANLSNSSYISFALSPIHDITSNHTVDISFPLGVSTRSR